MEQGTDGQLKLNFEGEEEKKHTKLDFGRTGDRIYIDAKQSVTLMGRAGGGAAKTGYYLLPVYTIIGNVLGRKAGSGGNQTGVGQDISPTLTESDRHAVAAPEESWRQKYRVRSLTPLECERLDGFPDNWTQYGASGKEMSSNARIKALGNSIAVPCAERVFRGIIAAEQEEREATTGRKRKCAAIRNKAGRNTNRRTGTVKAYRGQNTSGSLKGYLKIRLSGAAIIL